MTDEEKMCKYIEELVAELDFDDHYVTKTKEVLDKERVATHVG